MDASIPTTRLRKFTGEIPDVQRRLADKLRVLFAAKAAVLPPLAWEEYGLTIGVRREEARAVFEALKSEPDLQFDMLIDVTAVDWMDRREPRFDVVYQLLSLPHQHRLCVKIQVPEEAAEVDSVRPLWSAAFFLEREVWDMFGISFRGHGDLRRILMYDEFVGHPLRKDYPLKAKQPRIPLRIPELRNTAVDMHREELVALPVRKKAS